MERKEGYIHHTTLHRYPNHSTATITMLSQPTPPSSSVQPNEIAKRIAHTDPLPPPGPYHWPLTNR
jgi:hypothetical protein